MRFGGIAHANCEDGYDPERHGVVAADFVRRFRAEP
jgi:hypothetical protein